MHDSVWWGGSQKINFLKNITEGEKKKLDLIWKFKNDTVSSLNFLTVVVRMSLILGDTPWTFAA